MNLRFTGATLISVLAVGMSATVAAQQLTTGAEKFDLGMREYQSSCAACHGLNGKGDGPFSSYMEKSRVADLTTLTKRNGGVFPFRRVYEYIDGTRLTGAHGDRDMPIWGARYKIEAEKQTYEVPYDPAAFARTRILALVDYIYRLQAD